MSHRFLRVAKVQRDFVPDRAHEMLAAAALFAITGLFLLIGPSKAIVPDHAPAPQVFADFRDIQPTRDVVERHGATTKNVDVAQVLEVLGASPSDAEKARNAIESTNIAGVRPIASGSVITAYFEGTHARSGELLSVAVRANPQNVVMASRRTDDDFLPSVLSAREANGFRRIAGRVETTLADAIQDQGGVPQYAFAFAALFPDDPGVQSGGQTGDRFDIVFEVVEDERGNLLAFGDLVFGAFDGQHSKGSWYRFTPADTGRAEFYAATGHTETPMLARYPAGFVHITSGFGPRYHPVTGEFQHHAGIDLYGRYGTEIRATGDGVVERADWAMGYGRQIRINHKRGMQTLYAHMSAFADDIKPGTIVKKGDIIGYVGSSGTATGPHVHYEVRKNGIPINPMRIKLPSGRNLADTPPEMAAFEESVATIDKLRGAINHSDPIVGALTVTSGF